MNNYPLQPCRLIQDNDQKHASGLCAEALANENITWVYLIKSIYKYFWVNSYF